MIMFTIEDSSFQFTSLTQAKKVLSHPGVDLPVRLIGPFYEKIDIIRKGERVYHQFVNEEEK